MSKAWIGSRGGAGRWMALPLAAAIAGGAWGLSAEAQEVDLTMGIIVAPGDLYSHVTGSVPERVREATDGRVEITVSDSLVAADQIASAVRDGRLPMSAALHTYLAAEEPRMGIFNLPDLINDIQEYEQVRDAFWADDVAEIWLDRWNAIVLAEGAWCYNYLFSKEPIHSLEDFEGKRLRVHNPQTAALMDALGARPTPTAVAEFIPALERGVIDGLFTSACVANVMEVWREAPHVQEWRLGPVTGWAILVNQDEWEALPDDLRQQIQEVMAELEAEAFGQYEEYVERAIAEMDAAGAQIWSASEAERDRILAPEFAEAAYESWYARAEELGIDGHAYIDRVRDVLGK